MGGLCYARTKNSAILIGFFPFLKTQPGFMSKSPTGHIQPALKHGFAELQWQRRERTAH